MTDPPLLEVENLEVHFPVTRGFLRERRVATVRAVDGVSFALQPGRTLGIVGESGCGKTTLGRAIVGLTRPTGGVVRYRGTPLAMLGVDERRRYRRSVQMIFQDPYASLNPRRSVGSIVAEPIQIHRLRPTRAAITERVEELLGLVGLGRGFAERFAHQLSGGQRQRVGIARALAVEPELIVCDEPVSALDVSIQAQVLNLLQDLQARLGLAYLFIAHGLNVVRHCSDRVAVMYLGRIVELADKADLYADPRHPYTRALLSAVPVPDPGTERRRSRILLEGELPSSVDPPSGCRFSSRCPLAEARCRSTDPGPEPLGHGRWATCLRVHERLPMGSAT